MWRKIHVHFGSRIYIKLFLGELGSGNILQKSWYGNISLTKHGNGNLVPPHIPPPHIIHLRNIWEIKIWGKQNMKVEINDNNSWKVEILGTKLWKVKWGLSGRGGGGYTPSSPSPPTKTNAASKCSHYKLMTEITHFLMSCRDMNTGETIWPPAGWVWINDHSSVVDGSPITLS